MKMGNEYYTLLTLFIQTFQITLTLFYDVPKLYEHAM